MKKYLLAIIISVITVVLVFGLMNIYNSNKKLVFLTEVKQADLGQFITEKNDIIIYLTKNNNKELTKSLEEYLENNEIKNNIIYIDLNAVDKNFENELEQYGASIKLNDPTIINIVNGKVANYDNNIEGIEEIKEFLEDYSE